MQDSSCLLCGKPAEYIGLWLRGDGVSVPYMLCTACKEDQPATALAVELVLSPESELRVH